MIVKAWVILYVCGGCVQEPQLTIKKDEAEDMFEKLAIDQGFRKRKDQERFNDYLDAYEHMLYNFYEIEDIPEDCEHFEEDDEVHMYEYEIMIDNGRL